MDMNDLPELPEGTLAELDNLIEDLEIAELVNRRLSNPIPAEPLDLVELQRKLDSKLD